MVCALVKGHAGKDTSYLALVLISSHSFVAFTELLITVERLLICFLQKQVHLFFHFREVFEDSVHFFYNRIFGVEACVLLQESNYKIIGNEIVPLLRLQLSRQHLKKSSFAGSIDTDYSYSVSLVYVKGYSLQNGVRSVEFLCEIFR